jgi:hypothetical protein
MRRASADGPVPAGQCRAVGQCRAERLQKRSGLAVGKDERRLYAHQCIALGDRLGERRAHLL